MSNTKQMSALEFIKGYGIPTLVPIMMFLIGGISTVIWWQQLSINENAKEIAVINANRYTAAQAQVDKEKIYDTLLEISLVNAEQGQVLKSIEKELNTLRGSVDRLTKMLQGYNNE